MRRQSTPIERAVEDNWGPDRLTASLRERIQEVIITLVEGELAEVLAAQLYEQTPGRRGYRTAARCKRSRRAWAPPQRRLPRGRLRQEGRLVEWQSRLLPRYERRARAVDAAVLSVYLAGANQRRIKGALAPLLRGASLSKSAIFRLVGRIKSLLGQWRPRSLAEDGSSICIWTPLRCVSGWCRRW